MKLLMYLRDPLPPARVDVKTLFDEHLRARGVLTTYLGDCGSSNPALAGAAHCVDVGGRLSLLQPWRAVVQMLRHRGDTDLVLVRDQPVLGAVLFVAAAMLRLPRAYWRSFPMPLGDRVAAGIHRSNGKVLRAFAVWARGWLADGIEQCITLPLAHHVFVQSEAMRRGLLAQLPSLAARTSAVPMGVDGDSLKELPHSPRQLGGGPWIGYLGSLDRARQLDVLLQALAHLGGDAKLLLIGNAPRPDDLQWLFDHADKLGLRERVRHVSALPLREAWALMRQIDVAVSPIPNGPLYDVSSPTKVVEYLALGLPVVATDIPDQRELLEQCGGGLCVAFEARSIGQALDQLLSNLPAHRAQAAAARPKVLALRSYEVLAAQVEQRLHQVATR